MAGFPKAWTRIHETAEKLASGAETPSIDEARAIVWKIIQDEQCEIPPPDALNYLALELRGLVGYYRGDNSRSTQGLFY